MRAAFAACLLILAAANVAGSLMPLEQRQACEADLAHLQPCLDGIAEFSQLCITAINEFNSGGCFCGWGSPCENSDWVVETLHGLADIFGRYSGSGVACPDAEDVLFSSNAFIVLPGPSSTVLDYSSISREGAAAMWRMAEKLDFLYPDGPSSAAGDENGDAGFVITWQQGQPMPLPMQAVLDGASFDLDVQIQQQLGSSYAAAASSSSSSGPLPQLAQWVSALGMPSANPATEAEAQQERMDRTDDIAVLMGSLMRVVHEVTNKLRMDADEVSLSLEVTIEHEDEGERAVPACSGLGCLNALAMLASGSYLVVLAAAAAVALCLALGMLWRAATRGAQDNSPAAGADAKGPVVLGTPELFVASAKDEAEAQAATAAELRKPLLQHSH